MNNEAGATSVARAKPGSDAVLPFEQQERESEKAFAAFSIHLNMGPQRSLGAVASKLGKSKRLMEKWCKRHAWVGRVQAQSEYLASVEREGNTKWRKLPKRESNIWRAI